MSPGTPNATPSMAAGSGGACRGFLVALPVAVVVGLFVVVRSRREYHAMEARKASRPPDAED